MDTPSAGTMSKKPLGIIVSIIVLIILVGGGYMILRNRTTGSKLPPKPTVEKVDPQHLSAAPKGQLVDRSLEPFVINDKSVVITDSTIENVTRSGTSSAIYSVRFTIQGTVPEMRHAYEGLLAKAGYTIVNTASANNEISLIATKSGADGVVVTLSYIDAQRTRVGVYLNKTNK